MDSSNYVKDMLQVLITHLQANIQLDSKINIQFITKNLQQSIKYNYKYIVSKYNEFETIFEQLKELIKANIPILDEYKLIMDQINSDSLDSGLHTTPPIKPLYPDNSIGIILKPNVIKSIPIHKFSVDQIVGVRSLEGTWYLSRILYIIDDDRYPTAWYYIHYEGMTEVHREWVSSFNRIKIFNPRRDILYKNPK